MINPVTSTNVATNGAEDVAGSRPNRLSIIGSIDPESVPHITIPTSAMVFEGVFSLPQDGVYTFHTNSDDGSRLYVASEYQGDSAVSVINTATGTPIGTPIPIAGESFAIAVSPDGTKINTANGDSVSVINVASIFDVPTASPLPLPRTRAAAGN